VTLGKHYLPGVWAELLRSFNPASTCTVVPLWQVPLAQHGLGRPKPPKYTERATPVPAVGNPTQMTSRSARHACENTGWPLVGNQNWPAPSDGLRRTPLEGGMEIADPFFQVSEKGQRPRLRFTFQGEQFTPIVEMNQFPLPKKLRDCPGKKTRPQR